MIEIEVEDIPKPLELSPEAARLSIWARFSPAWNEQKEKA